MLMLSRVVDEVGLGSANTAISTMATIPRAQRPTLIHERMVAAVTRLSPASRPPDSAILRLALDARTRATMAGISGQMTKDAIDRMRAATAVPSVCCP